MLLMAMNSMMIGLCNLLSFLMYCPTFEENLATYIIWHSTTSREALFEYIPLLAQLLDHFNDIYSLGFNDISAFYSLGLGCRTPF